jgi:hypothetical protein
LGPEVRLLVMPREHHHGTHPAPRENFPIPFLSSREEIVNFRDVTMSFIWYAIFTGGSSCYHGAVAGGKGLVSWKQGSKVLILRRSLAISFF